MRHEHIDCGEYIIHVCNHYRLCNHLSDYVCFSRGFCNWCDIRCQPINKPYVLYYCKLGASILYPDEAEVNEEEADIDCQSLQSGSMLKSYKILGWMDIKNLLLHIYKASLNRLLLI